MTLSSVCLSPQHSVLCPVCPASPVKKLALISVLEGWEECSNLSLLRTLSLGWPRVALSSPCPGWPCALVWITLWPALLASLCLGGSFHGGCLPRDSVGLLVPLSQRRAPLGPGGRYSGEAGAEEAVVSALAQPGLPCTAPQPSARLRSCPRWRPTAPAPAP